MTKLPRSSFPACEKLSRTLSLSLHRPPWGTSFPILLPFLQTGYIQITDVIVSTSVWTFLQFRVLEALNPPYGLIEIGISWRSSLVCFLPLVLVTPCLFSRVYGFKSSSPGIICLLDDKVFQLKFFLCFQGGLRLAAWSKFFFKQVRTELLRCKWMFNRCILFWYCSVLISEDVKGLDCRISLS